MCEPRRSPLSVFRIQSPRFWLAAALSAVAVVEQQVRVRGQMSLLLVTRRSIAAAIPMHMQPRCERELSAYPTLRRATEMADDVQAVYEAIAETMRGYGYRAVTAAEVREIDQASPTEERRGVISMFAARQLQEARESGLLPPAAEQSEGSVDAE